MGLTRKRQPAADRSTPTPSIPLKWIIEDPFWRKAPRTVEGVVVRRKRDRSNRPPRPVHAVLEWQISVTEPRLFARARAFLRQAIREKRPLLHKVFYSDGSVKYEWRVPTDVPRRKGAGQGGPGRRRKVTAELKAQAQAEMSNDPSLNQTQLAAKLGIHRTTLVKRWKEIFPLSRPSVNNPLI